MRRVSRTGVAALLVGLLVLTGSFYIRPAIPSEPVPPWRWLVPWRIQTVHAGDEVNPYIWGMELVLLGILAKETLEALNGLAAEYLADYLRDLWEAYTSRDAGSPAGGGGGWEFRP